MQRPDRRRPAVLVALLGAAGVTLMVGAAAVAAPGGLRQNATESTTVHALVQRIDTLRIHSGCRPLVPNGALERAARAHAVAVDESGGVSHVDGVGGTAQDRAGRQGYHGHVIELVAQGSLRPDEFSAALVQMVNRTDLLECRFGSVGAAVSHHHLVVVLGDR